MKTIKRLLVNSIKDVLGEILFKKQKKDLFNIKELLLTQFQKIKLNLPEEKKIDTDDSKNEPEINEFF